MRIVKVYGRHPDLDEAWAKHSKLVYWWASKLGTAYRTQKREYLSILFLKFNEALWKWKEGGGAKFTSYFSYMMFNHVARITRHDADRLVAAWRYTKEDRAKFKSSVINECNLSQVPFKDHRDYQSWVYDIISELGGLESAWALFNRNLTHKERLVIYGRLFKGDTLEQIGLTLHVGRERVRQIQFSAICKIRRRLFYDKKFRTIAKQYGLKFPDYCYNLFSEES